MMVPAGALPCSCGRVSSVVSPLLSGPCTSPTLSVTVAMVAAGGGVISTVKVKPPEGELLLPAASVATTVKVCEPLLIGVAGVKLHAPLLSATAVPMLLPSRRMVTVAPGSAVPLSVGVGSLVVSPTSSAPVRPSTLSTTCVMTGVPGATLSTVILQVFDVPLTLPAASMAFALSTWPPSCRCTLGVKLH